MLVTESGIVTLVRPEQPEKTPCTRGGRASTLEQSGTLQQSRSGRGENNHAAHKAGHAGARMVSLTSLMLFTESGMVTLVRLEHP